MRHLFTCVVVVLSNYVLAYSTKFSVEHLSRDLSQENSRIQRTKIALSDELKVNTTVDLSLAVEASQSFVNNIQQYAKDRYDGFNLDISKFCFIFNVKRDSAIKVGVFGDRSALYATKNVYAPGVGYQLSDKKIELSSSYLNVPSSRKFYLNRSSTELASLWNSYLKYFFLNDDFQKLSVAIGYQFYSGLGSDIARQSGIRGNSTYGNREIAEFAYDYSIASVFLDYASWIGSHQFGVEIEVSNNLSAYDSEAHVYRTGISWKYKKISSQISILKIEKNAMIAVYTDEILDSTSVQGMTMSSSYEISKNFFTNIKLANVENYELERRNTSVFMSLNFRK